MPFCHGYTSFHLFFHFSLIALLLNCDYFPLICAQYPTSRNGPPRFKQNARSHQYAYLGDNIKFQCKAIGRPQPKVHWYREGAYLNYSFMQAHPRFREKSMSLEIRRIEVGDKGNWMCRVWNNEGSTTRNFTLHIVDFCDYFLNLNIDIQRIPEECLCQWAAISSHHTNLKNDLSTEPEGDSVGLLPPVREDLDLSPYNTTRCSRYAKDNEIAKFPRPSTTLPSYHDWHATSHSTIPPIADGQDPNGVERTIYNPPSALHQPQEQHFSKHYPNTHEYSSATVKHLDAKIELASSVVKESGDLDKNHQHEDEDSDEEDYDDEEEEGYDKVHHHIDDSRVASTTPLPHPIHTPVAPPDNRLHPSLSNNRWNSSDVYWLSTTRQWPQPPTKEINEDMQQYLYESNRVKNSGEKAYKKRMNTERREAIVDIISVAPYFRNLEEVQGISNIVLPAGRTLKLTCKAGGQPEPQVVWRKDNVEIHKESESKTGSLFRVRKWSLELEDAAESDSGEYVCEVFNSVGMILRKFRVDVQDRIRSRPILVPNVLLNQTIDVNNTVNFTCQVISDLVPHIVWIKLLKKNGSFIKWDPKTSQHSFNFLDMSNVKRARIFHNNSTNKYTLEIRNISMLDQGIYSCVAGNTLGMSMANATLIVNEFRPMTLPTENPYSWPISYTILLILSILLTLAFLTLTLLYFFFSKKFYKQNRVQNMDKMSVRKKVVITKKPQKEGDFSDLASSYAITVEPVFSGGSSGDQRPGTQMSSEEITLLSDYEVPTDEAWEIDRNRIKLSDVVGEGAFGEVWRGTLKPKYSGEDDENAKKMSVAVKKLKMAAHEKELIILVSEMQIFKSIGEHQNILKLIGCCTGLGPLMVVLEFCPHGNLRDFLRKHRPNEDDLPICISEEDETEDTTNSQNYLQPKAKVYQNLASMSDEPSIIKNLTLRDLVQFALEIARGMEFLANKKIIHRDLAARNVLVAENYAMKISDFGLSRNVIYHDYYRKRGAGRLPIKWMAPEALEANVYTVYSDVWSYGILLWEIMTLGGTPYPSIAMPQLYNILKEGYRMEAPHNCPDEIYSVMVMCWQDKPDQRPQFKTIADYFDWMLAESASHISKSDDGETTDEGPYAVINESPEQGGRRKTRPYSAPGLMSFEAFSVRENGANSSRESDESKQCEATLFGDEENCPLLEHKSSLGSTSPARKKNSLINQLQKHKVHSVEQPKQPYSFSQAEKCLDMPLYTNTAMLNHPVNRGVNDQPNSDGFFDSAIGSPLMSPTEAVDNSRFPAYENFRTGVRTQSNTSPRTTGKNISLVNNNDHVISKIHDYVNDTKYLSSTSASPIGVKDPIKQIQHLSQPSTATTTAASSTKSLQSPVSSNHNSVSQLLPGIDSDLFDSRHSTKRSVPAKEVESVVPKKSVVSEHGLRVHGVNAQLPPTLFSNIGQQREMSNQPSGSQDSTSKNSTTRQTKRKPKKTPGNNPHIQRSSSMESNSSSGHGGSSAMSSAEGLGMCKIEYVLVHSNEEPKKRETSQQRRQPNKYN